MTQEKKILEMNSSKTPPIVGEDEEISNNDSVINPMLMTRGDIYELVYKEREDEILEDYWRSQSTSKERNEP